MRKELTYIITFNAGAYGNFVGWFSRWLAGLVDIRPWNDGMNNSHNWDRILFNNVNEACSSVVSGSIVHPKVNITESLSVNIPKLLSAYDRVILMYPDSNSFIWNINNKHERVYEEGLILEKFSEIEHNLGEWNGKNSSTWELREWLSFYMIEQHASEVETNFIKSYENERLLKIPMCMLRDNFFEIGPMISSFLEFNISRSNDELVQLNHEWLIRQPHIHKDKLTKDLTKSIINDESVSMQGLTLVDTAEIQRLLRDEMGLELRCFGLDEWPNDTREINQLLIERENRG